MVPDGWKQCELGELAELRSGGTPSKENPRYWNGHIPWYTARDLKTFRLESAVHSITEEGASNGTRLVAPETILILVRGMTLLKDVPVAITTTRASFNQDLRALVARKGIDSTFLAYALVSRRGYLMQRVTQAGHGTGRLQTDALKELPILLPPGAEQQRIVAILSAWDRAIDQMGKLIVEKRRLKRGLMQQLVMGKQRFQSFVGQPRKPVRLGDVFEKTAAPVKVDPDATYQEIGIRSHGRGLFHKEPVSGGRIGNKRVYPVIPRCLTLNIVFAWEGALAVTTDCESGMIASHRFPMFRPNLDRVLPEYALLYLLSARGAREIQLASPGGAGRNRTLSQTEFLKTTIPLPGIAEQQKIVEVIDAAECESDLLIRELEALKKQKHGLMQKLLTGRLRVALDERTCAS